MSEGLIIKSCYESFAIFLRNIGERFNKNAATQLDKTVSQHKISNLGDILYLSLLHGATWVVKGMNNWDKYLIHLLRNLPIISNSQMIYNAVFAKGYKGTRKNKLFHILDFYHNNVFNNLGIQSTVQLGHTAQQNLGQFINSIFAHVSHSYKNAPQINQWTAFAPLKTMMIYLIYGKKHGLSIPSNVNINSLVVPLGSSVGRAIEFLFGKKVPMNFVQEFHRYLAELTGSNIFDINSGLYILGSVFL